MTKDYLCFKNWMDSLAGIDGVDARHIDRIGQEITRPVLVTSGGDTPITESWRDAMPASIKHWFAANVHVRDPRIHPIPIGIPSDATYGDFSVIEEFRDTPKTKELFACFCLGNNPPERTVALNQAQLYSFDWTVQCFQQNERKLMPHRTFIQEMARHEFVLCPPGAQDSDTHRQWEALYLGCIPIVRRTVYNDEFSRHFPMIVVDDWRDVTPEWLVAKKNEYKLDILRANLPLLLTLSYWVGKIKAVR